MTSEPTRLKVLIVEFLQPRLSGADFCALYRSMDVSCRALVVGMSRDHLKHDEMIEAGAGAFITKPFPIVALKEALNQRTSIPTLQS